MFSHPVFLVFPLVLAFAFCYAATRHERADLIIRHALRFVFWFFLAVGGMVITLELVAYFY